MEEFKLTNGGECDAQIVNTLLELLIALGAGFWAKAVGTCKPTTSTSMIIDALILRVSRQTMHFRLLYYYRDYKFAELKSKEIPSRGPKLRV